MSKNQFQATTEQEGGSNGSPKQPDCEVVIKVERIGKSWFVHCEELPHVHTFGHSLDEVVHRWLHGLAELYAYMAGQVDAGKEPNEQFKRYEQILGFGDRTDEPASSAVSMKQSSTEDEK